MRWLKYLFTVPSGEKVTEKHLQRVLISSVCSFLLCMTCLVSTTWAWFTTSVTSGNNVITVGSFTTQIDVKNDAPQIVSDGAYALVAGKIYTVTIKNTGNSKGYCQISFPDADLEKNFITSTLYPQTTANGVSHEITVQVEVYQDVTMTITNFWGAAPGDGVNFITIGEPPASTEDPEPDTDDTPVDDTTNSDVESPEDTPEPDMDDTPVDDANASGTETSESENDVSDVESDENTPDEDLAEPTPDVPDEITNDPENTEDPSA